MIKSTFKALKEINKKNLKNPFVNLLKTKTKKGLLESI